jgi:hypothetical protein
MSDPGSRHEHESDFERHARQTYDSSLDRLDAGTLSRLNQARNRALEAAVNARSRRRAWLGWAPAGTLAAGVLAAALLLRTPSTDPTIAAGVTPPAPVELLAAGEDLDIAAEADLGFYEWMAADAGPADEVGG